MNGYKDAHTHIHPSASATKAFMNALEFHGPWDGTIEQALPIMDKAGIAATMIVPLLADSKLLAERMAEARAHGAKPDREEMIAQLAAEQSAYNSWAAGAGARHQGRFAGLIAVNPVLFGPEWTRKEIAARLAEGAVGIKILPMYIGVYPADPRMAVVWRCRSPRAYRADPGDGRSTGRDPEQDRSERAPNRHSSSQPLRRRGQKPPAPEAGSGLSGSRRRAGHRPVGQQVSQRLHRYRCACMKSDNWANGAWRKRRNSSGASESTGCCPAQTIRLWARRTTSRPWEEDAA